MSECTYGRLAQSVRAPALQASLPLLSSPSVTYNSLRYQQLGEPARRSRATPIPSTNRGFDTVLIHLRSGNLSSSPFTLALIFHGFTPIQGLYFRTAHNPFWIA